MYYIKLNIQKLLDLCILLDTSSYLQQCSLLVVTTYCTKKILRPPRSICFPFPNVQQLSFFIFSGMDCPITIHITFKTDTNMQDEIYRKDILDENKLKLK